MFYVMVKKVGVDGGVLQVFDGIHLEMNYKKFVEQEF